MNGDSRETGKTTPDGKPDPSVFSTEQNHEGIRVGTVVSLMVRKPTHGSMPAIRYREFWGTTKRSDLKSSLASPDLDASYDIVSPAKANRYAFRPSAVSDDYYAWPRIDELAFTAPMPGLLEKRKGALVSFDKSLLDQRMRLYFDPSVTWSQVRSLGTGLTQDAAVYDAAKVRQRLLSSERFDAANVRRMMLLPMDLRWCYHTLGAGLWNRARPEYSQQVRSGIPTVVIRKHAVANPEGIPFFYSSSLGNDNAFLKHAYYVPLMLRSEAPTPTVTAGQTDFLEHVEQPASIQTANLSDAARAYLASIGIADPDGDMETAALLWRHVLAIGYAPAYLAEHEDGIRADWPRVPLPATEAGLRVSAGLGSQLAALLDTEQAVPHVTSGVVRPELRVIADLTRLDGAPPNPATGDFDLRARWGYASTNGIVMGGTGRLTQRPYTDDELAAIKTGAEALGLTLDQALDRLGHTTCDVYLNDRVCWRNVPARVWDFTIGGYQVIKKWLSYREYALLNRSLTVDEVRHVMGMARRLAAVRLLEPALDANYAATISAIYPWPSTLA